MATVYIIFSKVLKHSDDTRLVYVEEPIDGRTTQKKAEDFIFNSNSSRRAGLAAITIDTYCSLLQSDEAVQRMSYHEWSKKSTAKILEKYPSNLYWVSIELDT